MSLGTNVISTRGFGALLVFACACGGSDEADGAVDASHKTDSSSATDSGVSADVKFDSGNPQNPSGLGPAPVILGFANDLASAGSYALLAQTGITNVTGSSISGGHLGLSPAAASFITGFSLVADPTNVFSTSVSVVPPAKVYASDYAVPTPSNLTAAILSMQAAYTDAAGRSNPNFVNLGSGNLAGKTLAPGLYTFGSSVTIPDDVTIAGAASDVWIFQISGGLVLDSAKNVILTGGAQAKNVFWQVAGETTIHENSHFEGIILCKTGITLQTKASMHGRALAQSLIALDNNAVTATP